MPIAQKLLDQLIEKKILTPESWKTVVAAAEKSESDPEEQLVQDGLISEESLAKMKGELFGLPFVDLDEIEVSEETLKIIPQAVAQNFQLVLFEKKGNEVSVALVNPDDYRGIEAIDFWVKKEGYTLKLFICTGSGYRNTFRKYTAFKKEVKDALNVLAEEAAKDHRGKKTERLVEIIKKAPVAKIVALMIQEAVDLRTSDIHIEPGDPETRVRFRIDGILRTYLSLPKSHHAMIVSRIKVLADLKIDETRIPQDGRIRMSVEGQDVNLRVSTLPVLEAEKIVMRILPTSTHIITLEQLGFWQRPYEILKAVIDRPSGVLLVSGPTGSGKSTSLYSILTELNKESVNIVTLEDPVEYFFSGINQVQINPDVGLTFASGLRSILRQDPNIVMVGEIRDTETAELATHAALTGHFLLSTIHAKDVVGVIPRLTDMHVEPFLIAAALNTIMGQRLVRKICQQCKQPVPAPPSLEKELTTEIENIPTPGLLESLKLPSNTVFYKGVGCDECGKTGYKGRTVVSEIMSMTPQLSEILSRKFSIDDLSAEMKRQGNMTLKQDAILKALLGLTSLEEVLRITRE